MVSGLPTRLSEVRERIAQAARKAGRAPQEVLLMAVTKGFSRDTVADALACGISLFGENRVQEAQLKYAGLQGQWELHLIGHLQRNKAKSASGIVACVQSIDSIETARALNRCCGERERSIDVLFELNTSGEESKGGVRGGEDLLRLLDQWGTLSWLKPRGLMTVGPLSEDRARVRRSFAELRAVFEEIRISRGLDRFDVLSMGMSGDYEIAIEEGATMVRLGTAVFGPRG